MDWLTVNTGPFFYLSSQAPTYTLGIWSMIVSHLLEVCVIILFRIMLSMENKKRNKLRAQKIERGEWEEADLDATAFGDMTDRENENFRYVY